MFKDLIGSRVTVVVASKGDTMLEYMGTLVSENDNSIELQNVDISYLMLNFQKGIFGGNINSYKQNLNKVVINKLFVISCNL